MNTRSAAQWHQWLDELSRGSNDEAWRGIQCFFRWIEIRAQNGHAVPSFLEGLENDLRHSGLLRRLISGKEPLPEAPPESFGQPWYELIENGEAIAEDVLPWEWEPDKKLRINKGVWTISERIGNDEYIVYWRKPEELFRVAKAEGVWTIRRADRLPSLV